jgi:serine protease Do
MSNQVAIFAATLAVASFGLAGQPLNAPEPFEPPQQAQVFEMLTGSRSFLGVNVAEITAERARELKLAEERGVEIISVQPESAAQKAGLQKGDVVLEYQGQRVEGTDQFQRMVRETPVGRQVKLLINRGGSTQTIAATIGERKGVAFQQPSVRVAPRVAPEVWIPDIPRVFTMYRSSQLGIEAEAVDSQLAAFFGVKEGVLVRSVTKGSAAEKAGLKAGDVIVKVDKADVATPREVSAAVRRLGKEKSVPLTVVREKKEITLAVAFEEDESRATPRPGRLAISFQDLEF